MAPKAPEKSPQAHQTAPAAHAVPDLPLVKQHCSPFYISAHHLCHNKRLKQKRSKYAEFIRNALSRTRNADVGVSSTSSRECNKKTELRRKMLSQLTAEVTIDLLSDDEDKANKNSKTTKYRGLMCLERAALLGLMPVEKLQCMDPPPLRPFVNNYTTGKSATFVNNYTTGKSATKPSAPQLQSPQQQQPLKMQILQQHKQMQLLQQSRSQLQKLLPRKHKSRPSKRKSLPPPVLLNNESIILSDDSDIEQQAPQTQYIPFISPSITVAPDLTVVYPSSEQIPCPAVAPQCNTMQVDEEVTISLVPRSLGSGSSNSKHLESLNAYNEQNANPQQSSPPFPMVPDETTVHTVIANRIYELSLTKLREGLASCGIPEFNGASSGQQKISPSRRKGTVKPPPEMISPPQAPISLKLSSDLSISLISDDEDDTMHHRSNENLLSPAFLQKLPVNVSIAPVNITTTPRTATIAVDPRKLKFG